MNNITYTTPHHMQQHQSTPLLFVYNYNTLHAATYSYIAIAIED